MPGPRREFADLRRRVSQDERGVIEAPRPVPAVITLDGQDLVWSNEELKERSIDGKILLEFANLSIGDPERQREDVLAFAYRYGVLELCHHGQPYRHMIRGHGIICKPAGREPLQVWFQFAREVAAILRISAKLRRDERGASADWEVLFPSRHESVAKMALQGLRFLIAAKVDTWLRDNGVYPQLYWGEEGPAIRLSGDSVLAAVARQLAFEVAGMGGLVFCANCKELCEPKLTKSGKRRRPRMDRLYWCQNCGRKAQNRHANRRLRANKKS